MYHVGLCAKCACAGWLGGSVLWTCSRRAIALSSLSARETKRISTKLCRTKSSTRPTVSGFLLMARLNLVGSRSFMLPISMSFLKTFASAFFSLSHTNEGEKKESEHYLPSLYPKVFKKLEFGRDTMDGLKRAWVGVEGGVAALAGYLSLDHLLQYRLHEVEAQHTLAYAGNFNAGELERVMEPLRDHLVWGTGLAAFAGLVAASAVYSAVKYAGQERKPVDEIKRIKRIG